MERASTAMNQRGSTTQAIGAMRNERTGRSKLVRRDTVPPTVLQDKTNRTATMKAITVTVGPAQSSSAAVCGGSVSVLWLLGSAETSSVSKLSPSADHAFLSLPLRYD